MKQTHDVVTLTLEDKQAPDEESSLTRQEFMSLLMSYTRRQKFTITPDNWFFSSREAPNEI